MWGVGGRAKRDCLDGGPRGAPQTPLRSERPGEPVTLLDPLTVGIRPSGGRHESCTLARVECACDRRRVLGYTRRQLVIVLSLVAGGAAGLAIDRWRHANPEVVAYLETLHRA